MPPLNQPSAHHASNLTGPDPSCATVDSPLLSREQLLELVGLFFVRGSVQRLEFGAAPLIQYNYQNTGDLEFDGQLSRDVKLLQDVLGIGLFHYGPRLWMLGHITPLEELRQIDTRQNVIRRILAVYPLLLLEPGADMFRVRKGPSKPTAIEEYDAPPFAIGSKGRLDSPDHPVLYCSADLEICVHECRFTAEDELYVATISPTRALKLLDLTVILPAQEHETEFDSLDLAVHMLFLAGPQDYEITRDISLAARNAGYDGIAYSSYFSLLRTGAMPFETAFGLSLRRLSEMADYESSKMIKNIGIFGHPIKNREMRVVGVNRLVIGRVAYGMSFGPVDRSIEIR